MRVLFATLLILLVASCTDPPQETSPRAAHETPAARPAAAPGPRPSFTIEGAELDPERSWHVAELRLTGTDGSLRTARLPLRERRWVDFDLHVPEGLHFSTHLVPPAGDGVVSRDASGHVSLDLYEALLDGEPSRVGVREDPRGPDAEVELALYFNRGEGHASGTITVTIPVEVQVQLARELAQAAAHPLEWSAPLSADAPHPVLRVQVQPLPSARVSGDADLLDDGTLGEAPRPHAQIDSRSLPTPPRVRDVQLVAIEETRTVALGSCRCTLGRMASPADGMDATIPRERTDARVVVVEAATGRRVARRSFTGEAPPRCTPGMSCDESFGFTSRREADIVAWIRELASDASEP